MCGDNTEISRNDTARAKLIIQSFLGKDDIALVDRLLEILRENDLYVVSKEGLKMLTQDAAENGRDPWLFEEIDFDDYTVR